MKKNFTIIFLLIYSIISKLLISFYSILYDTNLYYQDGAVFVSMARMFMQGKVLYKEAFDHKAPYLYFIYALGTLLKERHLGLYIIEVFLLFIILLFIYKTLELFKYEYSLIVTLVLSLFLNSVRFTQGFFKTETCALAVFVPAVYLFAKYFISDMKKFNILDMFLIGLFAGFSFMVNIRAIILFVPFAVLVAFRLIKNKEFINLIFIFFIGILGVFISILPYLIYAMYTDSINDFYQAVIYTNLRYTEEFSNSIIKRMEFIKKFFILAPFFILYSLYSFIALFFIKFNKYLKISIILSYFIGLYYILFTGKDFLYYFVIIVPYFAFGIILLIKFFGKFIGKYLYFKQSFSFNIVFGIILIMFSFLPVYNEINVANKNCISRSEKLIKMFKDADINLNDKKLLALGFGPMVYTLLDIVPKYKYFYTPDVDYRLCPEPFKGQVDYITSLDPDIIVLDVPLKTRNIAMPTDFNIQDSYRMRDAIRTNYFLLGTYDMDESWGTYQIYIKK